MDDQNDQSLRQWHDEATARFVGTGSVVGVGLGQAHSLLFLMSRADAADEASIRRWAGQRPVTVEMVVCGQLEAGHRRSA